MIQIPENLDTTINKSDSRAKKTIENAISFLDKIGKKHTICEIGKERIRRAGEKIKFTPPSQLKIWISASASSSWTTAI